MADYTYGEIHKKMRQIYGTPSVCEHCKSTNEKAYDWANVSEQYDTLDRSDWLRLCRACHLKFDKKHYIKLRPRRDSTTNEHYIYYRKDRDKFEVQIRRDGKLKSYGRFSTIVEAIKVREAVLA